MIGNTALGVFKPCVAMDCPRLFLAILLQIWMLLLSTDCLAKPSVALSKVARSSSTNMCLTLQHSCYSLGACWASWCLITWCTRATGRQQPLLLRKHWRAQSRCPSRIGRQVHTRRGHLFASRSDLLKILQQMLATQRWTATLPASQDVKARHEIMGHVQHGQMDQAIELTERLAPGLLQQEPRLDFRLRCQKFIELVGTPATCLGQRPPKPALDTLCTP